MRKLIFSFWFCVCLANEVLASGRVQLSETPANGTNYVALTAANSLSGDTTFVWPSNAGDSGQLLQTDGSGNLSWVGIGSAGGFIQGGNSFGVNAALGTNDNRPLLIRTNGATAVSISQNGNVGIGVDPGAGPALSISAQVRSGFVSHSSANTNWMNGNIQTTNVTAGALTFSANSMFDGATYILILTSAGTFSLPTTGPITSWKCSPACSGGSNNQITATGHTVLTILKAGSVGYVSWGAGYQ